MATTRRELLLRAFAAGGAAAAGGLTSGCGVRFIDPAPVADVPAPVNGKISLDLSRYPDLARPGGALTIRPAGVEPILVVHWPDDRYSASQSSCTHAGCPLGFADAAVECPCHGARFAYDGTVINPPAPQPLQTYPTQINRTSGDLVIDLVAGTAGFPVVVNGKVYFPFADFPALRTPGGAVVGTPQGLSFPLAVIALASGFAAVNAKCTHLGCTVAWSAQQGLLVCPCHGSTFTSSGAVTKPPATKPLQTFTAAADATGVLVTVV